MREVGRVDTDTLDRVQRLHNGLLDRQHSGARALHVLEQLTEACGGELSPRDLQLILLRHPQVFTSHAPEDVGQVLAFLRADVGLGAAQIRTVVVRFPQVMMHSVKGHLRPQLRYLESLGVPQEQLGEFVAARPLLLGEGIESVIRFLRLCRVPRHQVAQLLRSYPVDFACRFIYKRAGQEEEEEAKGQ